LGNISFNSEQTQLIQAPLASRLFLQGPAGSGKTSVGTARLKFLVDSGIPANKILILVPQRTLAQPYYEIINHPEWPAGGNPTVVTLGGLGQRMISLFWPIIARTGGFNKKSQPPSFLTLETSQYYLALLVNPLLEQGFFQSIKIDRNRLLSQILDNLNKSAVTGIAHTEIAELLKAAWVGEPAQQHVYDEAQHCADLFRQFCLKNNLLDFSLQFETFAKVLWPSFLCREYLSETFRHLIYDNVEEDVPVAHDILRQWLPSFDSVLLIYDTGGGYRSFLGADSQSGLMLQTACEEVVSFTDSWTIPPDLDSFRDALEARVLHTEMPEISQAIRSVVDYQTSRFLPEMVDEVADRVQELIETQGVSPSRIAILSPFLSDSLRFSLTTGLEKRSIPTRTHRPSRSLREEPATLCLLTLARIAHPEWGLHVSHYDVRTALMQAIAGMDLVRADLLAQIVFRPKKIQAEGLGSFDLIHPDQQERVSFKLGELYERLRLWIQEYRTDPAPELDIFISRIFGEVLSQPGYGFHDNFDAAAVAARLVESIRKFRWATGEMIKSTGQSLGMEYIRMVEEGVVAAQYLEKKLEERAEAVFIAPAFTFLSENQPVDYQFWLDLGSQGWWERLYQPLTHPYVLTRRWPKGRVWTDADEVAASQLSLVWLTNGLLRRCSKGVFLFTNRVNETGDEQRGPLMQAVQSIFRRIPLTTEDGRV